VIFSLINFEDDYEHDGILKVVEQKITWQGKAWMVT